MGEIPLWAQAAPPSGSILLLSWEQVAAIVGPLVGGIIALFWLLMREMDRARKRAEDKEDDQAEKMIQTLDQLVNSVKQLVSMIERGSELRGPRN
mgnify:CR=1 FL=1